MDKLTDSTGPDDRTPFAVTIFELRVTMPEGTVSLRRAVSDHDVERFGLPVLLGLFAPDAAASVVDAIEKRGT